MIEELDRDKVVNDYIALYDDVMLKYESRKVKALVDEINSAIAKSDMAKINQIYEEISEWNNLVSNVQGARDSIMGYDKTFNLPSVKALLIVLDNITKEWRFNTEAY